jgi:hypothetical protein
MLVFGSKRPIGFKSYPLSLGRCRASTPGAGNRGGHHLESDHHSAIFDVAHDRMVVFN